MKLYIGRPDRADGVGIVFADAVHVDYTRPWHDEGALIAPGFSWGLDMWHDRSGVYQWSAGNLSAHVADLR
eukprot:1588605-Prymnesium_polylepis.2